MKKIKSQQELLERAKDLIESGKVDIFDIDVMEDHKWATADLWNNEKHLNIVINHIHIKLKEIKDQKLKEYYKKLLELAYHLLNETRKHRAKHLKRIEKLREFGFWCTYKHYLGAMEQFGEAAAKYIYIALEEKKSEFLEAAKECFETSAFCSEAVMLMNKFAENVKKYEKEIKSGENECSKGLKK